MNIEEKYQTYRSYTEDAIIKIERYRTSEQYKDLALFTDFILTTSFNTYGFLPVWWAEAPNTAIGLCSLLEVMHHALYDDGDICFPIYCGDPRISFYPKGESPDRYLSDAERNVLDTFPEMKSKPINITFLDGVEEFIKAKTDIERKRLKLQFLQDKRFNHFNLESYKNNPLFDPSWDLIDSDD